MGRLKNAFFVFLAMSLTIILLKWLLGVFAITVPLLFMFFDVSYSMRTVWICVKVYVFKYKVDLLGNSVMDFHVLPEDLDIFLHMNNSRYLRIMDFARLQHYLGCGLFSVLKKHCYGFILGASTIRYRRPLKLFEKVQLNTKIVYWDEKAFYVEQRFITDDGFVAAIAYAKLVVIQKRKKDDSVPTEKLFEEVTGKTASPPDLPNDLEHWMTYNSLSSLALRPIQY